MKTSDFFNKMPCIVDMGWYSEDKISDDDKIVRIELSKESFPIYTVYYFHRIYNDDLIYKCQFRCKVLPCALQRWALVRNSQENQRRIRWEGEPNDC